MLARCFWSTARVKIEAQDCPSELRKVRLRVENHLLGWRQVEKEIRLNQSLARDVKERNILRDPDQSQPIIFRATCQVPR